MVWKIEYESYLGFPSQATILVCAPSIQVELYLRWRGGLFSVKRERTIIIDSEGVIDDQDPRVIYSAVTEEDPMDNSFVREVAMKYDELLNKYGDPEKADEELAKFVEELLAHER